MKKIATVSVLAIMAVSAARADIASTTYVDKAAAGAVTTGLSATGNITAAITTATTDMATQNWVTNTATAAKATADASGNVITATYATKEDVNKVAGGELTIKPGAVDTTELADGSVTEAKLGDDVKAAYVDTGELNTALQPYANNTAGYQNASQVSTAISTATTSGVIKEALDGKVDDATLNNYYTKTEADDEFIDGDELAAATVAKAGQATTAAGYTADGAIAQALAGKVDDSEIVGMAKTSDIHNAALTIKVNGTEKGSFTANASTAAEVDIDVPTKVSDLTNDANYQTAANVTATLNDYYTKDAADAEFYDEAEVTSAINTAVGTGGAVKTAIDNALGSYSTTTEMNTELAKKQDKTTAVTHTANTAVGDTTHAVYIDSTGAAKVVEKVAAAATADSATKATQDASGNVITTTYATKSDVNTLTDGLGSLADVQIPDLPGECKGDDATADCTLVIAVGANNALTAKWEKVAR